MFHRNYAVNIEHKLVGRLRYSPRRRVTIYEIRMRCDVSSLSVMYNRLFRRQRLHLRRIGLHFAG